MQSRCRPLAPRHIPRAPGELGESLLGRIPCTGVNPVQWLRRAALQYAGARPRGARPYPRRSRSHGTMPAHEVREEQQMSQVVGQFVVSVDRIDGYEFRVRFDKQQFEEIRLDEPAPLGNDTAPNAARLLAASIGNCLAASLLFCLNKSKAHVSSLTSRVQVELVRNDARRLRIGQVNVDLRPKVDDVTALRGCIDAFEDFCVVTQSVREGIDVHVHVDTSGLEQGATEATRAAS
jgi:organic hydroperoxide reductase OsmC/OhrA